MGYCFSAFNDFFGNIAATEPNAILGAFGQLLADDVFYRGFRSGLYDAGDAAVKRDGKITRFPGKDTYGRSH